MRRRDLLRGVLAIVVGVGCGRTAKTIAPSSHIAVVSRQRLREELAKAKGSVVVLNFWATWCAPCVAEMPHFARLVERYGDRGVRVFAVSFDDGDTLETRVRPFVKGRAYPFDFYIKENTNGDAFAAFVNAVNPEWPGSVPATFVYDRSGVQRAAFYEEQTYESLERAITPLL